MFISGREARSVLETAGFSTWHARKALSCGLAGAPIKTKAANLYNEARVHDLAARPTLEWRTVFEICSHGIFLARRDLDVTRPVPELVEQASSGWGAVSPWAWLAMSFHLKACGSLAFVATVAGVVVLGADVVGTRPGPGLRLTQPGDWFTGIEGGRLLTGPGRPWAMYLYGDVTQ